MGSVREYYLTNYTKCPRCDTFLCTWQEVAYTFHSITIFSLPFYIFGGYCILYKTPKEMSSYRIFLFKFFYLRNVFQDLSRGHFSQCTCYALSVFPDSLRIFCRFTQLFACPSKNPSVACVSEFKLLVFPGILEI